MNEPHLQGIAHLLVQYKLLEKENALFYQQTATNHKLSLLQYLVGNNIIPPDIMASSVAQHFSVPMFDLDDIRQSNLPAPGSHCGVIAG